MTPGRLSEDDLIRRLRRRAPLIGDDCAVIPWSRTHDLLLKSDMTVEGVHFPKFAKKITAEHTGARALARPLSDIAAMGGTPLYCLISIAVAPWANSRFIDGFYRGIFQLLRKSKASLAGGDLSHASQFVCDVTLCGLVPKGKALRRSGAKAGDLIYVSGPLGGWRHKPIIKPRLEFGRKLIGIATASMDISDGLALDLHRLCLASRVAAELDHIPLLKGATIHQSLHDGEDYELLYTVPPKRKAPGIPIGRIVTGRPGRVFFEGKPLAPIGYDHFQSRT